MNAYRGLPAVFIMAVVMLPGCGQQSPQPAATAPSPPLAQSPSPAPRPAATPAPARARIPAPAPAQRGANAAQRGANAAQRGTNKESVIGKWRVLGKDPVASLVETKFAVMEFRTDGKLLFTLPGQKPRVMTYRLRAVRPGDGMAERYGVPHQLSPVKLMDIPASGGGFPSQYQISGDTMRLAFPYGEPLNLKRIG